MKERITVSIDRQLLEWLDKKIEEKVFASRSHGFEFLIMEMAKKESFFEHTRKSSIPRKSPDFVGSDEMKEENEKNP